MRVSSVYWISDIAREARRNTNNEKIIVKVKGEVMLDVYSRVAHVEILGNIWCLPYCR